MFGMFFMGSLYLQRVLGYDPLRSASPSCRDDRHGALSMRYSDALIMRFGARRRWCRASC